jgi:glycosyltransferase involved in cell wall biosynthesis
VTQYQREEEYALPAAARRVICDISASETTSSRLVNFFRRFKKLRQIWQSEKPEAILSFIGKNNMMAVATSCRLSIPVAVAIRNTIDFEYPTKRERFLAKHLFGFAKGIILQTEENRAFFPPATAKRALVLRNPVSPLFFRPRFTGEREKVIVAAGRLVDYKNHRLLIQAFAQIASDYPEYQVRIYGEGERREALENEVAALGLADRIQLPGISERLEEDLYRAAAYVLPSDFEGSPNSLIEALLLGLPCIATDCPCGGPAALIVHGENGLLIPVGDVAQLVESLRYLLDNPDVADRLGQEAHRLQSVYAPEVVYGEWERYIAGLRR